MSTIGSQQRHHRCRQNGHQRQGRFQPRQYRHDLGCFERPRSVRRRLCQHRQRHPDQFGDADDNRNRNTDRRQYADQQRQRRRRCNDERRRLSRQSDGRCHHQRPNCHSGPRRGQHRDRRRHGRRRDQFRRNRGQPAGPRTGVQADRQGRGLGQRQHTGAERQRRRAGDGQLQRFEPDQFRHGAVRPRQLRDAGATASTNCAITISNGSVSSASSKRAPVGSPTRCRSTKPISASLR